MIYILHGWSVDADNQQKWQNFINGLGKLTKVKFLPIPGLSSPLNEVWQLTDFINWLDQQLPAATQNAQAKGHEPIILLGHSFGGQLAAKYAATYPNKVDQLILIDSAGLRDHSFWPSLKRAVFWCLAKVGKIFFRSQLAKRLLYKLARERDYLNAPPLLKRTMSTILDAEIKDDLKNIVCPTLLIWGANDQVTPLKLAHTFKQELTNAQLEIIPLARHSPQFTHQEQVIASIENFFGYKKMKTMIGVNVPC